MKKVNPWYITGIVEGEGCFSVSFTYREKLKLKIEVRPSFSLSLHRRDLQLLKLIRGYFRCGGIRYVRSDGTYKFEVRSLKDIVKKVIPHFEKYPLIGTKSKDFEIFREICLKMQANLHRNKEHLIWIIENAYKMNPSGKRKYKKEDLLRVLGGVKV